MMFQVGEEVYVQWYGKTVDGVVEENDNSNPLLGSMIVVRIPVQGVKVQAVFLPAHVFSKRNTITEEELAKGNQPTVEEKPVVTRSTKQQPSDAWIQLQEFKEAHWDQEKNHLELDALDGFYGLWWKAVAAKTGHQAVPDDAIQQLAKKMFERDSKIEEIVHVEEVANFPAEIGMPPIEYHKPEKPIQVTQLELFG